MLCLNFTKGQPKIRAFSLRRVMVPSLEIDINLPRTYEVKVKHIGSAVSEILRYKQTNRFTNRQTDILLLHHKDIYVIQGGAQSGKGGGQNKPLEYYKGFYLKKIKMCVFNDSLTVESHLTIFSFFLNE